MTGFITIKKNSPYYYAVIDTKDKFGDRKQKWISTRVPVAGNNKRQANEKLKEILAEHEAVGDHDLSKDVLFTVFVAEWLENLKSSIEASTYDSYRLVIHNQIIPFYESKKLKLRDVTALHIQAYINFKLKTVKPQTVKKHLWNLSKCFDTAIKQQLITFNPVKAVDKPKVERYTGASFYTESQIDDLLRAAKGDMLEGIILIGVMLGLRRSEIIGLKWDAVNFEARTLVVKHTVVKGRGTLHKKNSTKTKSSYRTLPMPDVIAAMLKRVKAQQAQWKLLQPNDYTDEGYIFTREDGRLLLPNFVTKHFKLLLERNGLPVITFHSLRHTCASYLLYLGFDYKQIQYLLGHSEIGTTLNLYSHLTVESKRAIADILDAKFAR